MADLSLVTDKYFTIASETFTDNLSASIAAGAATVPVLNNSEYTNGDDVVLTVDPGTVNEATFIGRKSGLNFINCVWTEGNVAVGHSNGATVIDYDSATHHNAQTKGILVHANSDGTLKTQPVRDALGLGATAASGWEVAPYTFSVTSGYNKGQREFDITVANADVTDEYSPGTKLRIQRGTTAPTQCADLEASSLQFAKRLSASVTGTLSTFTDDFTVEFNYRPESYTLGMIFSRTNAAANNGWYCQMNGNGQIALTGQGAAARTITAGLSLSLDMWTHVAATLDMSAGTGTIYYNGISIPLVVTGAGVSITNSGDLAIGAWSLNPSQYTDGKCSDFRIWNVVRTQTQIRDNMYQQLVGTETNLIGYWKLNGDFNDSTSALNHLTAQGGAVATDLDNPFNTTEYAIVVKAVYGAPNTTLTVVTPQGGSIPNLTLTAPYYSAQRAPYAFPADRGKWTVEQVMYADGQQSAPGGGIYYNLGNFRMTVPTGAWNLGFNVIAGVQRAAGADIGHYISLSQASNTSGEIALTTAQYSASNATYLVTTATKNLEKRFSAALIYYLTSAYIGTAPDNINVRSFGINRIYAENMYV